MPVMQDRVSSLRDTPMRCLLLLALFLAAPAHAAGIDRQVLAQTGKAWDGTAWRGYPARAPEVTLLRLRIPAHVTLDWHQHPMINLAYVVSGAIRVERRDTGTSRTFAAGDVIAELVDVTHRGHTGEQGAELLVFYAGAEELPLSVPDDCTAGTGPRSVPAGIP